MDHFALRWLRGLLALLALLALSSAHAVYVDAEPPAGWREATPGGDGYARLIMYPATGAGAAPPGGGAAVYIGPDDVNAHPIRAQLDRVYRDPLADWLWRQIPGSEAHAFVPAAVYGAGAVVTTIVRAGGSAAIPAFLKFGPNAGRAAASQGFRGAAVGLFASMILAAGLQWVWDEASKTWQKKGEGELSTGWSYEVSDYPYAAPLPSPSFSSLSALCSWLTAHLLPNYAHFGPLVPGSEGSVSLCTGPYGSVVVNKSGSVCPVGWYSTPAGCLSSINNRPLTQKEFEDGVENLPWPQRLPEQLPEGVPVESPVINPLPSPWDRPQPFFEPVGDPIKNPQFDPTKQPSKENPPYIQPGRRITGTPTGKQPWRTDVQPVDRPVMGPEGEPGNGQPDPTKAPEDAASSPAKPDKGDREKTPLLCEAFPNISACQPLGGAPDAKPIPNQNKPVAITPEAGFGPSDGTCPAPRVINTQFVTIELPWDLVCQFAQMLRPLIIAMAWLTAALTFLGLGRKGD